MTIPYVLTLHGVLALPPDSPPVPPQGGSARIESYKLLAERFSLDLTSASRNFTFHPVPLLPPDAQPNLTAALLEHLRTAPVDYLARLHPATRARREARHGPFPDPAPAVLAPEELPRLDRLLNTPPAIACLLDLPSECGPWGHWIYDAYRITAPWFTITPHDYAQVLAHATPAAIYAATHHDGPDPDTTHRGGNYFTVPYTDLLYFPERFGLPIKRRLHPDHDFLFDIELPGMTRRVVTPSALQHYEELLSYERTREIRLNEQRTSASPGGRGRGRPKGAFNRVTARSLLVRVNRRGPLPIAADNPLRRIAAVLPERFTSLRMASNGIVGITLITDPTTNFTQFTPLHPGPGGWLALDPGGLRYNDVAPDSPMRLPFTAINYAQPDTLFIRSLLLFFSRYRNDERARHFDMWPMTVRFEPTPITPVPGTPTHPLPLPPHVPAAPTYVTATLSIPLPPAVVHSALGRGTSHAHIWQGISPGIDPQAVHAQNRLVCYPPASRQFLSPSGGQPLAAGRQLDLFN